MLRICTIPTMMGFYRRLFVRIQKWSSSAKAKHSVRWKAEPFGAQCPSVRRVYFHAMTSETAQMSMKGFCHRLAVSMHKCSPPVKANNAVGWKVRTIWSTLSERTHSVFTRDDLSNCANVDVHDAIACTYRAF